MGHFGHGRHVPVIIVRIALPSVIPLAIPNGPVADGTTVHVDKGCLLRVRAGSLPDRPISKVTLAHWPV